MKRTATTIALLALLMGLMSGAGFAFERVVFFEGFTSTT